MSRKNAVRVTFLAVALILLVVAVVREREALSDALARMSWGQVAGATALVLVGLAAQMLSWRALFTGSEVGTLPLRAAGRIYFVGQLGKYVPGSVWAVVAQADLGRDHKISRARSAVVALAALVVLVVVGVAVGVVALWAGSGTSIGAYWWTALVAVAGLVVLWPRVLGRLVGIAMRTLRRTGPVPTLTPRGIVRSAAWAVVMWAAFGAHAWLLADGLHDGGWGAAVTLGGAYALAWVVGFVIVIAPAGAGPREVAFVLLAAAVLDRPDALLVALVSRALMVLGDAVAAAAFLGRRGLPRTADPAGTGGVPAPEPEGA